MASFNKVVLMGNLTREPELRYTGSGTAVCTLGLAVNKTYKTQSGELREEPCFIDITVWGRQAEAMNNHLHKGSNILVDGELKYESWQDKTTGQNRYKHTISANEIRFLGDPQKNNQLQQQYQQSPQQPTYTPPAQTNPQPTAGFPSQMPQQ